MMIIKKNIAVVFAISMMLLSCNTNNNNTTADVAADINQAVKKDSIAVYIFPVERGFGYAIFINRQAFIRQDCIPVIQGNKPFSSRDDARKTGELVAAKIRNNELATLTITDLNKLGITQ